MSKLTKAEKEVMKKIQRKGGMARKKQNPDYSALGKKGMDARWHNKENNESTNN